MWNKVFFSRHVSGMDGKKKNIGTYWHFQLAEFWGLMCVSVSIWNKTLSVLQATYDLAISVLQYKLSIHVV